MNNKLFVAGLEPFTTDSQLTELFTSIGQVLSAKIIIDRTTGKSNGYGFVEMKSESLAIEAIKKLNGIQYNNRQITVKEVKPQTTRY